MKFVFGLTVAIVLIGLGACKKSVDQASTSPTFASSIVFSSKTATSFTATWLAGDDTTAVSDITYKVVYSLNNNITTAADAEANGTVAMDWTTNALSKNITSLTASTLYYVAVLARDTDGNTGISSTSTSTLCSGKIMFLTAVTSGNFGGASGADTLCNSNKPTGFSGSTFKAMVSDTTARNACYISGNDNCASTTTGRAGWVFTASETLCTSDYSIKIGVTNSYSLLQVSAINTLSSSTTATYTGFNVAWGSSVTNACSNFGSTAGTGIQGTANGSSTNFFSNTIPNCTTAGTIYCVEQ